MALTSRQRLLRLFNGQDLDRVPIWLLAPYHRLVYYADLYNIEAYRPVTQAIETCCDAFDRRRPELGFCYNVNPDIQVTPVKDEHFDGNIVTYGGLTFKKGIVHDYGRTSMQFYVDDPEQLEDVLSIPYVMPVPDADRLRREKEELGERGLLMMDLGDSLEPLYHLCSAEDFSMWTITDYDSLLDFSDQMLERSLQVYKSYLDLDIADAYFIVGAEFAGPPLVSPSQFNALSVRYVKKIVDLIRSYGKIAIVHYHGQLYQVLEGMHEINPDGLHTIEAPPIGDCTITQAREKLGPDTVLIGNVQYDDLERQEPGVIDAMVRDVMEEGRRSGRFILSPSAGPYDPNPSPTLIRNYLSFIDAGIRYGKLN